MNLGKIQLVWWWGMWWRIWPDWMGPWPYSPGVGRIIGSGRPFHGCIYRWRVRIWMLEIRRWA